MMEDVGKFSKAELLAYRESLNTRYAGFQAQHLKLDMSRGKPAATQLDLTNGILFTLTKYVTEDGIDARNYGGIDGIPEAKRLFSGLLGIPEEKIIIGGNSSLNLMYDAVVRFMLFGTGGHTPWRNLPEVKFLCPSPGYDRHFGVCDDLGIKMITIPMTPEGPDMDLVEKLAGEDESIKGIWCVPLYSNPQGICYSDRAVERLGRMKTAADDFRIMWDNAYGVHHIYSENKVRDIFEVCENAGHPDRVFYFFSTSKITFPGAGVALLAASPANVAEIKKHLNKQTIGPDKLNQLRTVTYLKTPEGVREHMRKLAAELRPKFDIVLRTLEHELSGTGLASWTNPQGGYFVSVETLPGCAKTTVALAAKAGVKLTPAGATFPYGKDPLDTNIRLAPTYPAYEELQTAMELFCVCIQLAGVEKLLAPAQ